MSIQIHHVRTLLEGRSSLRRNPYVRSKYENGTADRPGSGQKDDPDVAVPGVTAATNGGRRAGRMTSDLPVACSVRTGHSGWGATSSRRSLPAAGVLAGRRSRLRRRRSWRRVRRRYTSGTPRSTTTNTRRYRVRGRYLAVGRADAAVM